MLSTKLPDFLTELEIAVLQFLVREETEDNRILSDQLATCSLKSRERNGYGFFTNFHIADSKPQCSKRDFELGDAAVIVGGELCGFILFVRDGKATFLEGFPLGGDAWPLSETFEKVTPYESC
jgi:hypothetical protein